jgi:hypothetical protein
MLLDLHDNSALGEMAGSWWDAVAQNMNRAKKNNLTR